MPGLTDGAKLLGASALGLAVLGGTFLALTAAPIDRPTPEGPQPESAQATVPDAKPSPGVAAKPDEGPFVIKRILPIKGPIKYGEWHWDEAGVPEGPIVITVDLDARVISVFRAGYEIGAAAVLLGSQEKPTPTGVFPITEKKRDHTSNLYDAPMPYMQRLTNDGISLHATKVEWGYASHGCIGMPLDFAAKVFGKTKLGDRVFITRGKMVGLGDSLVDS